MNQIRGVYGEAAWLCGCFVWAPVAEHLAVHQVIARGCTWSVWLAWLCAMPIVAALRLCVVAVAPANRLSAACVACCCDRLGRGW